MVEAFPSWLNIPSVWSIYSPLFFLLFHKYCMGWRNVRAELSSTDVEHMYSHRFKARLQTLESSCGLALEILILINLGSKWFLESLPHVAGVGLLLSGQVYQTDFCRGKLWEIITSIPQTQCKTTDRLVHKQVLQVPQLMPGIISKLCVWLRPTDYYPPHADHRQVCLEGIFLYLPISPICLPYILRISS